MLLVPDPATAFMIRSRSTDADPDLQFLDPSRAALLARSAPHRAEGRDVPEEHRHRRHGLFRSRARVLRLRRRAATTRARTTAITRSIPSKRTGRRATRGPNLGYKLRHKEGYFPVPPPDTLQDLRTEMCSPSSRSASPVEAHHHEVATAGQCEIDMRFTTAASMGDKVMIYKYVVKNVAAKHGKTATFMPKPLFGDNGSGMHVHQSLWKDEQPLFAGDGYAGLSDLMRYYIGGILKHAPALLAFCAPTTNSYRRLVPGYEAPVNLAYSQRNRSAASASRCTRQARRPSASSSAARIRPAIRTSRSPPC